MDLFGCDFQGRDCNGVFRASSRVRELQQPFSRLVCD